MGDFGSSLSSATHKVEPRHKTKSRKGCLTCKLKRLKCDEQKPFCMKCTSKNIKCGGYAVTFKWRSFDGSEGGRSSTLDASQDRRSATAEPDNINNTNTNNTNNTNNNLTDHIERASLLVVGKSMKDIKFENELIQRGINPATYSDSDSEEPVNQSMRRSYSQGANVSTEELPTKRRRSYSTSSFLNNEGSSSMTRNRNHGLESLVEVAVDEIRKSPGLQESTGSVPERSLVPVIGASNQSPKEWLINDISHPVDIASPAGLDSFTECNLTPSLTALMTYVFNSDKDMLRSEMGRARVLGAAPSPLNLAGIDLSPGAELVKTEPLHEDVPELPGLTPSLLSDVGEQLMRVESTSLTISLSISMRHLLHTSEQEQILLLYSTYTCGIMSIKSGFTENPWRNIFVPLAANYPYLFDSIASMTLFHLAGNTRIREKRSLLRSKGYFYMKRCILELASGLSRIDNDSNFDSQFPADIALATCLNLAVSESWDTHTSSGIAHLKGAKSMIQRVLNVIKHRDSSHSKRSQLVLVGPEEWQRIEELEGPGSQREMFIPRKLQLLFNQWIYFEVLSQMTLNSNDDKGIDLVAAITNIINVQRKNKDESAEFLHNETINSPAKLEDSSGCQSGHFDLFESLETLNSDYVDPLLGCAQSLFLIMGKVATLILKIRRAKRNDPRASRNSLSIISVASELRQQLLDWQPSMSAQFMERQMTRPKDSTWDVYSCISTAEAYRYATLLYLHQAVPEIPSMTSHQLAEKIFVLLASIPPNSNLYIVHIFPLLVGSCEASPGEEREWCERRWELLTDRIWIGNIDRAIEVVKEVWRRKDEANRNKESGSDLDGPTKLSAHLSGIVHSILTDGVEEITGRTHWSSVMREWGWEVLLA